MPTISPPRRARRLALAAGLVLAFAASAAPAQTQKPAAAPTAPLQQQQPQPAQIDRNGVLILVRSTLLAVHQANLTGNYTVLRDLGAPGFQSANSAARLGEIFASQRAQGIDLSGVAVLDPQLTVLPEVLPNGLMRLAGFFPSVPLQVNFELIFSPVEGRWRLFGISVNVGQAGPVAPAEAAPEPAPQPAAPAQAPQAQQKPRPPTR